MIKGSFKIFGLLFLKKIKKNQPLKFVQVTKSGVDIYNVLTVDKFTIAPLLN